VVAFESGRGHEIEEHFANLAEALTAVFETVIGPVVILDDHLPAWF